MRSDRHARVIPERAAGWQRFLIEHVERSCRKKPAIERGQNIGLVLQTAASGIDQHRRAERPVALQLREHRHGEDTLCVGRQRQQTDEYVGSLEEFPKAVLAVIGLHAIDLLRATAPAGEIEAEQPQLFSRIAPEHTEAHDADSDFMSRRLAAILMPDMILLLLAITLSETVMVQHLPDDIFGHAHGKIVGDDAHQRYIGNPVIAEDVIDACAQREDHLQIGQVLKRARLLLPDERIFDGRIFFRAIRHHRTIRRVIPKRLQPDFRVPVGDRQKDVALGFAHCLAPPSVASIRKAAAINALV